MRQIARMMAMAAMMAAVFAASGATVLKNAPWATSSVVTNGMGAAHDKMPANVTNFTIEAWVKPSTSVSGSGNYIFSVLNEPYNGRIVFSLVSNKLQCYYYGSWYSSNTNVALNVWSHVAVVRSPDGFDFYINGEHVGETVDYLGTNTISPDITKVAEVATDAVPVIGCQRSGVNSSRALADVNNHVFQGCMSDVRMWTTARTAGEIAAAMGTRLTGQEDGLYLYVPFTDGKVGESVVKNLAEGYDLIVPPTQELVWDPEIDAKFGAAEPVLPYEMVAADTLESTTTLKSSIQTDVRIATNTYTISAWVRLDQTNNTYYFVGQYVSSSLPWVSLDIAKGGLKPRFRVGSKTVTSDTNIRLGEWFHVAGTRDENGLAKLYLNGAAVGQLDTSGVGIPEDAAFELFNTGSRPNSNYSMPGSLREVYVWNYARSATEIAATFKRTVTGREPGLIGYWPLSKVGDLENKVTGCPGTITNFNANMTYPGIKWHPASVLSSSYAENSDRCIQTDVKIGATDFTLETWARIADATPSGKRYLLGQYDTNNKDRWVSFQLLTSGKPSFNIGSASANYLNSNTAVKDNEWFHLAATRSGRTVTLYLNGAQVATGTGIM